MNAHDRNLSKNLNDVAQVHYGDGDMTVLRPGRFVICAVSGKPIALEDLRYWSPVLQEAFAGPAEALARWKSVNPT